MSILQASPVSLLEQHFAAFRVAPAAGLKGCEVPSFVEAKYEYSYQCHSNDGPADYADDRGGFSIHGLPTFSAQKLLG